MLETKRNVPTPEVLITQCLELHGMQQLRKLSGSNYKNLYLIRCNNGTGTSLNNVQFNVGTTTVTWTAKDILLNTSTCTFDVVITQSPEVITSPVSQSVCLNGSVTLTAAATGTPAPTYQWRKDGVNISGETGCFFNT